MNYMNSSPKIIRTIFVVIVTIMGFTPLLSNTQQQLANALDFDISDFKCITAVGNIGNNICSEDNSVDNSTTNNIDERNFLTCTFEGTQSAENNTNSSVTESITAEFCNNVNQTR